MSIESRLKLLEGLRRSAADPSRPPREIRVDEVAKDGTMCLRSRYILGDGGAYVGVEVPDAGGAGHVR